MKRRTHLVVSDDREREAAFELGTPVTAACGKTWVPSRDPDRYAICPDCVESMRRRWMA